MNLKSELFKESYCIFVSEVNDQIKEKIRSYGMDAIKVLKATFQDKLYCIVIPGHYAFKVYEKELFDLYKETLSGSGFWGQYSMGYAGKEWSTII